MNAAVQPARHKLSVENYHRMGDAGIFSPECRVELIDGEIFDMAPMGSLHSGVVAVLNRFFCRNLFDGPVVFCQSSILLPPDSEPEPDLAILKYRADGYRDALPKPDEVLLLIEVGDSSAAFDRQIKLSLYARHLIPEVWLIDLNAGHLDAHTEPRGGRYAVHRRLGRADSIRPAGLMMPELALSEIWPATHSA